MLPTKKETNVSQSVSQSVDQSQLPVWREKERNERAVPLLLALIQV